MQYSRWKKRTLKIALLFLTTMLQSLRRGDGIETKSACCTFAWPLDVLEGDGFCRMLQRNSTAWFPRLAQVFESFEIPHHERCLHSLRDPVMLKRMTSRRKGCPSLSPHHAYPHPERHNPAWRCPIGTLKVVIPKVCQTHLGGMQKEEKRLVLVLVADLLVEEGALVSSLALSLRRFGAATRAHPLYRPDCTTALTRLSGVLEVDEPVPAISVEQQLIAKSP